MPWAIPPGESHAEARSARVDEEMWKGVVGSPSEDAERRVPFEDAERRPEDGLSSGVDGLSSGVNSAGLGRCPSATLAATCSPKDWYDA